MMKGNELEGLSGKSDLLSSINWLVVSEYNSKLKVVLVSCFKELI